MLEVWPRPPLLPPPPSLQRSPRHPALHVRINRSIYRDRLPNLTWLDGRSRVWLKKKKTTTSSLSEDDKDKREAEDQVSWMDGEVNRHKLTISHLDQLIRHELMRWQFWMLIRDSVHCLSERPLSQYVRWLPPEEFIGRGRTASGLILRWLAVVNDDGIMSKQTLAITCKNVISTTP